MIYHFIFFLMFPNTLIFTNLKLLTTVCTGKHWAVSVKLYLIFYNTLLHKVRDPWLVVQDPNLSCWEVQNSFRLGAPRGSTLDLLIQEACWLPTSALTSAFSACSELHPWRSTTSIFNGLAAFTKIYWQDIILRDIKVEQLNFLLFHSYSSGEIL